MHVVVQVHFLRGLQKMHQLLCCPSQLLVAWLGQRGAMALRWCCLLPCWSEVSDDYGPNLKTATSVCPWGAGAGMSISAPT